MGCVLKGSFRADLLKLYAALWAIVTLIINEFSTSSAKDKIHTTISFHLQRGKGHVNHAPVLIHIAANFFFFLTL